MALSTSYYTVDDEIVGESRGGTKVDYLTDALGSVTAKVNQAGAVISSARYKPYGDMMSGPSYIFGGLEVMDIESPQMGAMFGSAT